MKNPILVIMAAGMGSRYGGLKQIEPVGPSGEIIMDYSIYDAVKAGFERLVCIIKQENKDDFDRLMGAGARGRVGTAYAFQSVRQVPDGFTVPEGREKPWGTAQAVLSAREIIGDSPFLVINSDDYYGPSAFKTAFDWFGAPRSEAGKQEYGMVGYLAKNTMTDHGAVTRGVCETDARGKLSRINERTGIEKSPDGARFPSGDGAMTEISGDTLVSMNFWCLTPAFLDMAARDFPRFLSENLPINSQKCEYLLPAVIDAQIRRGEADVSVLKSEDKWYGVTYKEDKASVSEAMRKKHETGLYPSPLWQ
jgi:NDP-sugar pyrophosphorylase family protein